MKVLYIFAALVCYAAAAGQWEKVDTDDEEVKEISNYAAKYVNENMRSQYHHKLVKVRQARKQIVAGVQYEVKLQLEETNCKKTESSFEDAAECDVRDGSTTKYCTVTVWEQSWKKEGKHVRFNCHSTPY